VDLYFLSTVKQTVVVLPLSNTTSAHKYWAILIVKNLNILYNPIMTHVGC